MLNTHSIFAATIYISHLIFTHFWPYQTALFLTLLFRYQLSRRMIHEWLVCVELSCQLAAQGNANIPNRRKVTHEAISMWTVLSEHPQAIFCTIYLLNLQLLLSQSDDVTEISTNSLSNSSLECLCFKQLQHQSQAKEGCCVGKVHKHYHKDDYPLDNFHSQEHHVLSHHFSNINYPIKDRS